MCRVRGHSREAVPAHECSAHSRAEHRFGPPVRTAHYAPHAQRGGWRPSGAVGRSSKRHQAEKGGSKADVSVLGFDDIYAAAFHNPALTTIRQPLFEMGSLAAETLLGRLAEGNDAKVPEVLSVEPTLVVRNSTARVTST